MWTNAHETYLEDRVMAADRLELVRMLYSGAMDAVRTARAELAAGRIGERSKAIGRAYRILSELATSLDKAAGAAVAQGLLELYDYMMRRLNQANFEQKDQPLAEVLDLLNTLAEAWSGVMQQQNSTKNARSGSWEEAVSESGGYRIAGYAPQGYASPSHAWSF